MNWARIVPVKQGTWAAAVAALLIFRLLVAASFPLLDKTEARYAEISRIMAETDEWVVPQVDYGTPFWAKPPLSIWLGALSFRILGVHELGARAPALLLSVGLILILGNIVRERGESLFLVGFVLLTTPQFLIHAGVISTDASLAFCTTLIMISFWNRAAQNGKLLWGYLFFIAIGLGILTKGPLVLVLTMPALFLWWLMHKKHLPPLSKVLPWSSGIALVIIITLPWFYLMEKNSPGFIQYFVVGEHFGRFTQSGWHGDLYGTPKTFPPGMIWLFLGIFSFPWVQVVGYWLWKNRHGVLQNHWVCFLFIWLVWTPVFFTFSSNILHTYILPICPPLALLVLHIWKNYKPKKVAIAISLIFPVVAFAAFLGFLSGRFDYYLNTDRELVAGQLNTIPIYYWKQKTYSSQFYSKGGVKAWNATQSTVTNEEAPHYLLISKHDIDSLPPKYLIDLVLVGQNQKTILLGPPTWCEDPSQKVPTHLLVQ